MQPPILLRVLPDRLKQSIACRWYSRLPDRYLPLIKSAKLRYANGAAMPCLLPTDVITSRIALTGFHELQLTKIIQRLAWAGGRMVDVGANQGYFSLIWLANRAGNTCVAVEASPRILPFLQGNITANKFDSACRIVESAAGSERSRMSFDLGPEEQTGWGGLSIGTAEGKVVEVEVTPLDEIITDNDPVHALKIDVEGADTWVLKGAKRLLKSKQIKNIFFEQHAYRMKILGIDSSEAVRLLEEAGYRVQLLNGQLSTLAEYRAVPV